MTVTEIFYPGVYEIEYKLYKLYSQVGWKYEAQPFILRSLSVFINQRMNPFECLNFLLKSIHIYRENRD